MVIKSRWMRWLEHVACMGENINGYMIFVGKCEGQDCSEDLDVKGRIM
jgi:hypothetical protein